MSVTVPGQTLSGLENAAGDLAVLIEQQLAATMRETLRGTPLTAAARDNISPDDLNAFLASWQTVVDDVLMGAIEAQYLAASLEEIDQLLASLAGVLSAAQLDTVRASLAGQAISESLLATARNRLVGVGEEVWLAARDELVTGLQAGDSIDDMTVRIVSATDELGETRATRIARTETISVRNAASLNVVDQIGVASQKRWQATNDSRTRETHLDADGQIVDREQPFSVGGFPLQHPGDPAGPPEEIINCRCTMVFEFDEDELQSLLQDPALVAAANEHVHDGAMIALVPTAEDAERLAIDDMEPADELHLTLMFLGSASEIPSEAADDIATDLERIAAEQPPITAFAFAADWFNPLGDDPAWVLGVSSEMLPDIQIEARVAAAVPVQHGTAGEWEVPAQHSPWVAHVTLAYSPESSMIEQLPERLGDITFDRLRLAVGEDVRDFPLGGGDSLTAAAEGAAMPKTALQTDPEAPEGDEPADGMIQGVAIVEGIPTGDGRQFAEGSVDWPDPAEVIINLEWQKETTHGGTHDVVVTVGRLTKLERVGNEIRFEARIDTGSEDGAEAFRRYSEGFIGGVSIVADDPEDPFGKDVELVWPAECEVTDDMSEDEFFEVVFNENCMSPDLIVYHSARIRSLTLVNTAAFVEASADVQPLQASATHTIEIPDRPPFAWFQEPTTAPEIGTITVTDEGKFFGYVAPKNVSHRALPDQQVPLGNVDYRRWMNKPTIVASGERIATGAITMDCGHAGTQAWVGAKHSIDHYDNACSVVATARIGENGFGVWIAGALVPGVTGYQVARMLACQLSGDWRPHATRSGWREFTAALLVPVPGFTSASMRIEGGALVASSVPVRGSWGDTGSRPAPADSTEARAMSAYAGQIMADVGLDAQSRAARAMEGITS